MGVCLLALKMFNKASLTVKSGQDPEGKPRRGRAMMEHAQQYTYSTMLEPNLDLVCTVM